MEGHPFGKGLLAKSILVAKGDRPLVHGDKLLKEASIQVDALAIG